MGPRLPGICKYDIVVELIWSQINVWGLGIQEPAEVANMRRLGRRLGDVIRTIEILYIGDLPLGQGQAYVQSCIHDDQPH